MSVTLSLVRHRWEGAIERNVQEHTILWALCWQLSVWFGRDMVFKGHQELEGLRKMRRQGR